MKKNEVIKICVYSRCTIKRVRNGRWYEDDNDYFETMSSELYASEPKIFGNGIQDIRVLREIDNVLRNYTDKKVDYNESGEIYDHYQNITYSRYEEYDSASTAKIVDILNKGIPGKYFCAYELSPSSETQQGYCSKIFYHYNPLESECKYKVDVHERLSKGALIKLNLTDDELKIRENLINCTLEINTIESDIREIYDQINNLKEQIREKEEVSKNLMNIRQLYIKDLSYIYLKHIANYYYNQMIDGAISVLNRLPKLSLKDLSIKDIYHLPIYKITDTSKQEPLSSKDLKPGEEYSMLYPMDIALLSMNKEMITYLLDKGCNKVSNVYIKKKFDINNSEFKDYISDKKKRLLCYSEFENNEQLLKIIEQEKKYKALYEGYPESIFPSNNSSTISLILYILNYLCIDNLSPYYIYLEKFGIDESIHDHKKDVVTAEILATLRTNDTTHLTHMYKEYDEEVNGIVIDIFDKYNSKYYKERISEQTIQIILSFTNHCYVKEILTSRNRL